MTALLSALLPEGPPGSLYSFLPSAWALESLNFITPAVGFQFLFLGSLLLVAQEILHPPFIMRAIGLSTH